MNGKKQILILSLLSLSTCMVAGAENSFRLKGDSLLVSSGTTYRYTVDTPEGEGLTQTSPSVSDILGEMAKDGTFKIVDKNGKERALTDIPADGDKLQKLSSAGKVVKVFPVGVKHEALMPELTLKNGYARVGASTDITLDFKAGQRTPDSTVDIFVPKGIDITPDNITVDVIGRGAVVGRNLSKQSIGKTGKNYSYNKVGECTVTDVQGGRLLRLSGLDLRPDNGTDVRIVMKGVRLPKAGDYEITASYTVSAPERLVSPKASTTLKGINTIADFAREPMKRGGYRDNQEFSWAAFSWTPLSDTDKIEVLCSEDKGKTWKPISGRLEAEDGNLLINRLPANKLYAFKLRVKDGKAKGDSNIAWFYSGEFDPKDFGAKGDGVTDDTDALNSLIDYAADLGGGVIRFKAGDFPVRTLHMRSNVWLHVDKDAVIKALLNADAPETTWFSDRGYRSGLSPTDPKPYKDPENYMTKQDVGHTYFNNTMFHGERVENVKIVGSGRITGNGNIVTTDRVMNNDPEKRNDKMFTFKLCKDIEIGGIETGRDMWYDEERDEPYYIEGDKKVFDAPEMLHIDQGGHFVLLATGTDGIYVHDTYFGKYNTSNARDIYDFMGCNDVRAYNIYSRVCSDDIVKPGSDCSLGFTRPVSNYLVRNIVGDTNCNLFQIGSETADDIQDLYVDNIYVLGANKAGFSISTNDGAHIKNVYLNSGKTGPLHHRSVMKRTRAPFFISISNRGRVIGADVKQFAFEENGATRNELLVTNSNIGRVENIFINGVDISEVYGGSSFRKERWKPYDGTQTEAAAIIAGFKLPDNEAVEGGLGFTLPDGRHTGYIENISFNDVNLTVKGGHPDKDSEAVPPEIGVGRYNVVDMKIQPAYGFWFRHAKNVEMNDCDVAAETKDGRYPVVLDDVIGAKITNLDVKEGVTDKESVKILRSKDIQVK